VRAVRVDVTGRWGPARRTVHSFALSTPDALPRGLVVHGDVVLQSSTALQECGLYAGGDVSGREHVVLTSPPDTPPATEGVSDLAWGGLYLEAGVHARGTIWQSGAEEHQAGDAPAVDSDTHTGVLPPAGLVAEPSPALLAALITHSSDPRAARGADGVDLALLDQSAPPLVGDPQLPAAGRIYVVSDDQATAVVLFGARPSVPQACPMTLVVLGDCTTSAGAAGESPPRFAGALVVTGTLLVEAPLLVDGGVYAARLVVHAPLAVVREPTTARDVAPGASYIHSGSCTQ
jgi:hypothetical protein